MLLLSTNDMLLLSTYYLLVLPMPAEQCYCDAMAVEAIKIASGIWAWMGGESFWKRPAACALDLPVFSCLLLTATATAQAKLDGVRAALDDVLQVAGRRSSVHEWNGAGVSSRVPGAMDGCEHDRLLPSPSVLLLPLRRNLIIFPIGLEASQRWHARTFCILSHDTQKKLLPKSV